MLWTRLLSLTLKSFLFKVMLEIEPRALCMLGKHFATEFYPRPLLLTLGFPMGLMGNSKLDPRGFKESSSALRFLKGDTPAGLLEGRGHIESAQTSNEP